MLRTKNKDEKRFDKQYNTTVYNSFNYSTLKKNLCTYNNNYYLLKTIKRESFQCTKEIWTFMKKCALITIRVKSKCFVKDKSILYFIPSMTNKERKHANLPTGYRTTVRNDCTDTPLKLHGLKRARVVKPVRWQVKGSYHRSNVSNIRRS